MTFPVCEPNRASPYTLDQDLPAPPVPTRPVDVTLKFTLNGRPWPAAADANPVGTITFTPEPAGPSLTKEILATSPSELRLAMEPGAYRVSLAFANTEKSRLAFPPVSATGRLVVRAPGIAAIPFQGVAVSYEVTLNGAAIPALPANSSLWVTFSSWRGPTVIEMLGARQTPRRAIFLEPGRYTVGVQTNGETASLNLPAGATTVNDAWDLAASPVAASARFDLSTVDVSGAVRLNGRDLGAATRSGYVDFLGNGVMATRFAVSSTRPARYQGKVFRGAYDVFYDGMSSNVAGMPRGGTRVERGVTAGGTLDVDLVSVAVSGEVTRNNAVVPDSSSIRGAVTFRPKSAPILFFPVSFNLPARGRATFSGSVFAGTYDVFVEGHDANVLPTLKWPARRDWQPSATPLAIDIPTRKLDVTVKLNGAQPANAAASAISARGSFSFNLNGAPATADAPLSAYALAPATGPLKASVVLPPGNWTIRYGNAAADYTGMPQGNVRYGAIDLVADSAITWDIRAVDVSGTLTVGGRPLPAPARSNLDRGKIGFWNVQGGGGIVFFPIATSGAGTYRAWLFPGVHSVSYVCFTSLDCDATIAGQSHQLLFGIEFN